MKQILASLEFLIKLSESFLASKFSIYCEITPAKFQLNNYGELLKLFTKNQRVLEKHYDRIINNLVERKPNHAIFKQSLDAGISDLSNIIKLLQIQDKQDNSVIYYTIPLLEDGRIIKTPKEHLEFINIIQIPFLVSLSKDTSLIS